MSFGDDLKKIREDKNMTQKELANKSGLSEISIRKYESGDRTPKYRSILKIANALGVGLDNFLIPLNNFFTDNSNYVFSDRSISELNKSIDTAYNAVKNDIKPPQNLHSVVFKSLIDYAKAADDKDFDQLAYTIEKTNTILSELLEFISNKNGINLSEPQIQCIISKIYDLIDFEVFKANRNDKK
jgi:transcriptional regulator with XRE-family HTH domain